MLQRVKTILHEYAHSIDFTLNPDENISRHHRELIAESTAFVVAMRLVFDTSRYSTSYLQSWKKDEDDIQKVADSVQKVSAEIIKKLAESGDPAFAMLQEDKNND